MEDYYRILNLEASADEAEIKKAFNREMRMWSNRSNNAPQMERRQEAERMVKLLEEAERVLLDSTNRAEYDRSRPWAQDRSAGHSRATADRSRQNEGTKQSPDRTGDAASLIQQGWRLLIDNRVDEALEIATRASQLEPTNADAWAFLGQAKFRSGNIDDAIYEYKRAIKLCASEASYYGDLGSIYESVERWELAIQQYERAAQIDPKTTMYRAAIGIVHVKTGNLVEAIGILERCVAEDPQNQSYQQALGYAYVDGMLLSWWKHDDQYYCLSEQQALQARAVLQRARALRFDDAELRGQIEERGKLVESMFVRQFKGSWAMVILLGLCYVVPGVLWWWVNRRPTYKINRDIHDVIEHNKADAVVGGELGAYYSALPPGFKWIASTLPRPVVWFVILLLSPFTFLYLVYDNYGPKHLAGFAGAFAVLFIFVITLGGSDRKPNGFAHSGSAATQTIGNIATSRPAVPDPDVVNSTFSSQQLVGSWKNGAWEIAFNPDGTYTDSMNPTGRWRLNGKVLERTYAANGNGLTGDKYKIVSLTATSLSWQEDWGGGRIRGRSFVRIPALNPTSISAGVGTPKGSQQRLSASPKPIASATAPPKVTVLNTSPNGQFGIASVGSGTIDSGDVDNFYIFELISSRELVGLDKSIFNHMTRNTYTRAVQFLWSADSSLLAVYVGRKGVGNLFAYSKRGNSFQPLAVPNLDSSVFHSSDYLSRPNLLRAPLDHYRIDGDWRQLKAWDEYGRLQVVISGTLYGGLAYQPSVNQEFYTYELAVTIAFADDGRGEIKDVKTNLKASSETVPQVSTAPLENRANAFNSRSAQVAPPNSPTLLYVPTLPGERFPETRTRFLTEADVQSWDDERLRYAINEMYARRGADFRDKAVKKWFQRFSWYHPIPGATYDDTERSFTDIEKRNEDLLGAYRNTKKGLPSSTQSSPLQPVPKTTGGSLHERTRGLDNL